MTLSLRFYKKFKNCGKPIKICKQFLYDQVAKLTTRREKISNFQLIKSWGNEICFFLGSLLYNRSPKNNSSDSSDSSREISLEKPEFVDILRSKVEMGDNEFCEHFNAVSHSRSEISSKLISATLLFIFRQNFESGLFYRVLEILVEISLKEQCFRTENEIEVLYLQSIFQSSVRQAFPRSST